MSKIGENGIVVYSDEFKNLYILSIDNIDYQSGMVYFKNRPAYRLIFDKKLQAKEIENKVKGFRISKLPGFVNRPKKETGQLELPGLEKKEKKPMGGYPKLFNCTKDLTRLQDLSKCPEFDDWIVANHKNYNLSPTNIREFLIKEIRKILNEED